MRDGVSKILLPKRNLTASVAVVSEAARTIRRQHSLARAASSILSQALCGGALISSLQKEDTSINLQLECDGPLRGLLVDANSRGAIRAYVKNPLVEIEGAPGEFRWRPVLGNSGFVSVLRDSGQGEYYRSSVELQHMDLVKDLGRYFAQSDQLPTRVAVVVEGRGEEPLGVVAGVVAQVLPDADAHTLDEGVMGRLEAQLRETLLAGTDLADSSQLALRLFDGEEPMLLESWPVDVRCSCSHARVVEVVSSLPIDELQQMLDEDKRAVITCHFCVTRHEVTADELRQLIASRRGAVS